MAKLFFGKFTQTQQFEGHYYIGEETWFNGIKPGDYVFVINDDIKALWKASNFEKTDNDNRVILHFDEVLNFNEKEFQVKDLVSIKKFQLNVDLCVKTIRSTAKEKKGFYEIILLNSNELEDFLTPSSFRKYFENPNNYRNVLVLKNKESIKEDSEDLQFYKDGENFSFYKPSFISNEMNDGFKDRVAQIKNLYSNLPEDKKRRSKRLKTVLEFEEAFASTKPITKDNQSLNRVYDVFFSKKEPSLPSVFFDTQTNEFDILNQNNELSTVSPKKLLQNLNVILFGPPGTGKTYSTKKRAVEICNGISKSDDEAINEEYEKLLAENRISFVTFHQSFGYEEFVEGIKPTLSDDESGVKYEIKNGILKTAAINAAYEYVKAKNALKRNKPELENTFENRWEQMISEFSEKLESQEKFNIPTSTKSKLALKKISNQGNPVFTINDNEYAVSFERTKKLWKAFPDVKKIKSIDKEIRAVIGGSNSTSYFIVLEYLQGMKFNKKDILSVSDQNLSIEKKQILVEELTNADYANNDVDNHVLVIDEINRGNVAQIFGESITLIEKSKRAGSKDAVKIQLSYSGAPFVLPPNLFIVGTMNTADRSIESLDAALRRRFSFEELAPDTSLLQNISVRNEYDEEQDINLSEMLNTINNRLEFLLDHDHTIGHAYFLPEVRQDKDNADYITISSLKSIFENSIIPQLKEYFYNDWEKIQLILSPAFIETRTDLSPSKLFFNSDSNDILDDERKLFSVTDSTNWTEETFQKIYIR